MYTILLLGGNGLIGSKISEILKETRKFNVFNLDKNDIDLSREANISAIKKRIKNINPNIIIILASIKRQQGEVHKHYYNWIPTVYQESNINNEPGLILNVTHTIPNQENENAPTG